MRDLKPILIREEIIKAIRSFFYDQNFHEMIVPIFNDKIPTEPNIYPFTTIWETNRGKKTYYLATSPERGLKSMLAQGIGNCFAISKSFRNLENSGSLHQPEFLMLEWYRKSATYQDIMEETKELIIYLNNQIKKPVYPLNLPWKTISLIEAFGKYAGVDYLKALRDKSFFNDYDQIFVNKIEPNLTANPTFIIDFPSRISPFCKKKKDNPLLAERFELYINKMEIGNGNTENTNWQSIEKNMPSPVDHKFLAALKAMAKTKESYAGIGLGIDRLTMLFSNIDDLSALNIL